MSGQNNADNVNVENSVDVDKLWDEPTSTPKSSFAEPEVIENDDTTEVPYVEHAEEEKPARKKRNYPILIATGVIGLLIVSAASWAVMDQVSKPSSKRAKIEPVETLTPAAVVPVASVFDKDDKPVVVAPAIPAVDAVVKVSADAVTPTNPSVPVVTGAAVDAKELTTSKVVSTVNKPATPIEKPKVAKIAKEQIEQVGATEPVVKIVRIKSTSSQKSARSKRVAKNVKGAKTMASAASSPAMPAKAEILMLPKGLKVTSIYPQVGADVQAWLTDSSGRLEIVRVGDTLVNGIQIVKITPETGEVFTSAGVITYKGAGR